MTNTGNFQFGSPEDDADVFAQTAEALNEGNPDSYGGANTVSTMMDNAYGKGNPGSYDDPEDDDSTDSDLEDDDSTEDEEEE